MILSFNEKNIPERLKQERRWVLWRPEVRGGKPTKVPVAPNGGNIDATDSTNWLAFDDAVRYARERGWGIGFALGDGYVGVDIDKCYVDDERGRRMLTPLADYIVRGLQSYTERSPSGEGIHVIVWAGRDIAINRVGPVEVYTRGRFFTITGDAVAASDVNDATQALEWLEFQLAQWRTVLQNVRRKRPEFVDAAKPGARYDSDSEADMALAGEVVRTLVKTGEPDQTLVDAAVLAMWLFPRFYRSKWLRDDYVRRTVEKAVREYKESVAQQHTRGAEKKSKLIAADILELLRSDNFPVDVRTNILGRVGECYLDGSWLRDAWARTFVEIENQLRKRSLQTTYQAIDKAIAARVEENVCNPMKEWLGGLSWDGTPRVEGWLINFFGVEDTPLAREAARRFLVGAVARAMEPGCPMDWMLVLQGEQGIGKTKGIRALFGEEWTVGWSFDHSSNRRDTLLVLHNGWCAEVAELAGMGKKDIAELRSIISESHDDLRRPYGYGPGKYPRHTVMVGTTNDDEILRDPTGNRRFVIVRCADRPVDLQTIRDAREQLWAEALHLYRHNEKWWWDANDSNELREAIKQMHREYEEPPLYEATIKAFCEDPAKYTAGLWDQPTKPLADLCIPGFVHVEVIYEVLRRGVACRTICAVLRKMGYKRIQVNDRRFWYDPNRYTLRPKYTSWEALLRDRTPTVGPLGPEGPLEE